MAFDRSTGTKWFSGTNAGSTGWIRYDLGAGVSKAVRGYQISSANDMPTRDPMNWQFQGSNNGTTWTTLDTRSGETFRLALPDQYLRYFQYDGVPLLPPEHHGEQRRH